MPIDSPGIRSDTISSPELFFPVVCRTAPAASAMQRLRTVWESETAIRVGPAIGTRQIPTIGASPARSNVASLMLLRCWSRQSPSQIAPPITRAVAKLRGCRKTTKRKIREGARNHAQQYLMESRDRRDSGFRGPYSSLSDCFASINTASANNMIGNNTRSSERIEDLLTTTHSIQNGLIVRFMSPMSQLELGELWT